ncbi:MAG: DNA polymerase Y family protein [Pseudomonadota bacterium]
MKRFVSIWLANFPIERLRRAKAPGRVKTSFDSQPAREHPFALAMSGARGITIAAVNQSARRAGVQIGQTVADARSIFPALMTQPAEPENDARALNQIAMWAGRYGPNRNTDGDDGLWIETTGVAHLFGGEAALLQDIACRLEHAGFTTRIAIADTIGAAHALARFANRRDQHRTLASPGQTELALQDLPVDALRLTEDSVVMLKRLGLRRIGQLTTLPRAALARRFREDVRAGRQASHRNALARAVVWRLDQALGRITEPLAAMEDPPVRRQARAFAEPLISSDGVEVALKDLVTRLCHLLRTAGEGALRLRLCLYRSDGTRATVMAGTSTPSHMAAHIFDLFRERLDTVDAGMGVDLIALEALRVDTVRPHQAALTVHDQQAGDVAHLIDRLTNKLGERSVLRLAEFGSHLPEYAEARRPAITHRDGGGSDLTAPEALQRCGRPGPRPSFLLPRPEPISVVAELPEGAPARFRWRRVSRRIVRSDGPERIAPEWWTALADTRAIAQDADSATRAQDKHELEPSDGNDASSIASRTQSACRSLPRTRDYYVLEDEQGGRYWVFRDGLYTDTGESSPPVWYMHGLFG